MAAAVPTWIGDSNLMNIYNNTNDELQYLITNSTLEHDGTAEPGQTADEPDFDNQQGVTATFNNAAGSTAFSILIPESKEGMTVTVGIYFE
jgi:hypothetical protein